MIPRKPFSSTEIFIATIPASQTIYFAVKSSDTLGNISALSNAVYCDYTAPQVVSINPAVNTVVSRPRNITATVSDDISLAQVHLSFDGVDRGTFTAPPFTFFLNSLDYEDGDHQLAITARDQAGNETQYSRSIFISYAPPPSPSTGGAAHAGAGSGWTTAVRATYTQGRQAGDLPDGPHPAIPGPAAGTRAQRRGKQGCGRTSCSCWSPTSSSRRTTRTIDRGEPVLRRAETGGAAARGEFPIAAPARSSSATSSAC